MKQFMKKKKGKEEKNITFLGRIFIQTAIQLDFRISISSGILWDKPVMKF